MKSFYEFREAFSNTTLKVGHKVKESSLLAAEKKRAMNNSGYATPVHGTVTHIEQNGTTHYQDKAGTVHKTHFSNLNSME